MAVSAFTPPPDLNDSPCTVVPKVEELDDAGSSLNKVQDVVEAKLYPTEEGPRKRGRPRKHPVVEQKKSTHIRSKTGCKTCRRRKKKCDEARPSCQNCEKNNVLCEGYDEKKQWRSGKQKSLEHGPAAASSLPEQSSLEPTSPMESNMAVARPMRRFPWPSVQDDMDHRFMEYFRQSLSRVLSVNDHYNPFTTLVYPMAEAHPGLMASLLYLSGSSLVANATTVTSSMSARQEQLCSMAVTSLNEEINKLTLDDAASSEDGGTSVSDPLIAQMLLFCLQTVCSGDLAGQWQSHLRALKFMLSRRPQSHFNTQFRQFVLEFLIYHDYSSAITAVENPLDQQSLQLMEHFGLQSMVQPDSATLLGVTDGLFGYISRIRTLRDQIRQPSAESYAEAQLLHEELAHWTCPYAESTPRYWASLLYRQCVCLYLHRTVMPSQPCPAFKRGVDDGLEYLRHLPRERDDSATQSILLMPLFLLGCSAFEPAQRREIAEAFDRLQNWSSLGNIKYARKVVEEIWQMMDDGRAEETWYWEGVLQRRGWNFLIT
ncbi:hypothetical protein CERZMDRAFT_111256 [Cercospora zeae-maydis SCOH1-5]|uniref:Zn(2)-C6 fungal-type domain-containing protein n=1 Tax=Cercospora zeae-maydis SCOH1-5 TaxID=717836 RepID=A0A6A6FJP0_9PEZI|nr:hypothetical protein CERZMDRAFT_111256 [Cercospora zeae-maydis SCOH1-5]